MFMQSNASNRSPRKTNTDLTLLQHNVLHWRTNGFSCLDAYREKDPDVILLNSTGVLDDDPIVIPGYTVRQANPSGQQSSGSAIAVRTSLACRWKPVTRDGMLRVVLELEHERVVLATHYLPPRAADAGLIRDIRCIADECLPTYFLSDVNAHHRSMSHTFNDNRGKIITQAVCNGHVLYLGPHFDTFISGGHRGRPDTVLANNKTHHSYFLSPGPPTTSDHCPVIMKISARPIRIPIKTRFAPAKADWARYRAQCNEYSIPDLEGSTRQGVEEAAEALTEFLSSLRKEVTPMRTTRTLPAPSKTPEIRKLERRQRVLYKRIRCGNRDRRISYEYTTLRGRLRPLYVAQRKALWEALCERVSAEANSASFWRQIRRMLGEERVETLPRTDQAGNQLETKAEISRAFSRKLQKQFCISDDENADFDQMHERQVLEEWERTRPDPPVHVNTESLPMEGLDAFVSPSEMLAALNSFKEKAPGASGISKRYIVEAGPVIHMALACLFNAALSIGYFPACWKVAQVVMVPKRPKPSSVDDFRPISLLEVPGKLLEKVVNQRLQRRLENFNVYQNSQFGFRGRRGCREAIALGHEFIGQRLAEGLCVRVVLRDVKSAFDKVWHTGLCVKLARLSLPPRTVALVESFLTSRAARVVVGDHPGDALAIRAGVPQGAILSPTLYNIYVADVPGPRRRHSRDIIFADDISQIVAAHPSLIKVMVESEVRRVNTFEHRWKIRTNQTKFKIIALDRKVKSIRYSTGSRSIHADSTGLFLGFPLNRQGVFPAARKVAASGRHSLANIARLSSLSENRKRMLYLALVRSRLVYPVSPWAAMRPNQLYTLQVIQNKAMDFIGNYRWYQRLPQYVKHTLQSIEPLNLHLQQQNRAIWSSLEKLLPHEVAELKANAERLRGCYRLSWPSSLLAAYGESIPDFCTLQEARELA